MAIRERETGEPIRIDGNPLDSVAKKESTLAEAAVAAMAHKELHGAERVDTHETNSHSDFHGYDISKMKANLEALGAHAKQERVFSALYPTIRHLLSDGVHIEYILQQLRNDGLPLSEDTFKKWLASCDKLGA